MQKCLTFYPTSPAYADRCSACGGKKRDHGFVATRSTELLPMSLSDWMERALSDLIAADSAPTPEEAVRNEERSRRVRILVETALLLGMEQARQERAQAGITGTISIPLGTWKFVDGRLVSFSASDKDA